MKVLVTGATGFVGTALVERLTADGVPVVAAVRRDAWIGGAHTVAVGDIGPRTDWRAALAGVDRVVHLAARAHVTSDQSADPLFEFRKVNVEGTLALARQAAAAGVQRVVFVSSIGVNGIRSERPFSETDTPVPVEPYAISKLEAEEGLMRLARQTGMEVVILRPPLVYGPDAPGNFGRLLKAVRRGVPLPLGAVRNNRRSLVALDNLVDLIAICIDYPAAANQVFLAGDGEDLSTSELLRRMAAAMGKPDRLLPVPENWLVLGFRLLGKGDLAQRLCGSLQVDISKAREQLGWNPPVSVDEGLRKATGAFLRSMQD